MIDIRTNRTIVIRNSISKTQSILKQGDHPNKVPLVSNFEFDPRPR